MIIAHALMNNYNESLIYKKAVNDFKRKQWLKAMQIK